MFLAFAAAGLWLLFLAFEIGDVYPPFSSHRSELDGTEVLYEALERLPEMRVERHYGPAASARGSSDTTILVPGFSALDWELGDEDELRDLVGLAGSGGRLVIALRPSGALPPLLERSLEKNKERTQAKEKKRVQPAGEQLLKVAVKFGAQPKPTKTGGRTVKRAYTVLEDRAEALPERLPWRAPCYLEPRDPSWKTIYSWSGRTVLARRSYGKGEVVLIADSFLLTNRAMWEARHSDFLAWLTGGRRRVLFYERHLGVSENPGIAWLIKRYHLDGLVAALLLVTALFVWHNSVPLVPFQPGAEQSDRPGNTSRGSSLLALVSRSLPSSQVMQVCVDEWKKTERPDREVSEKIEKLAREKGDIVTIYRQIMRTLKNRS